MPTEVLAVGKDVGLQRQERPAGIDEIHAGEAVLFCDLLRAEMFLDGHRIVRAAFDRRVVSNDDAIDARDDAYAGQQSGRRRRAAVHTVCRERGKLEEWRTRVDEAVDAVACGQFPAFAMPLDRRFAAAELDIPELGA